MVICFWVVFTNLYSQPPAVLELEKKVYDYNNAFKYDSSQVAIQQFLSKESLTNEEAYYAYLYLSYTYKRLFDYRSTLYNLDQALKYGLQTDEKAFFTANILCQKALALFDTHRYIEADSLMKILNRSNYQYLNEEYQAKIIMQEAYLLFINRQYTLSETSYNRAIALLQKAAPCDLPMIYSKKIELYGAMQNDSLLYDAYHRALASADTCGIYKYTIYTIEMMYKTFARKKQYQEAYFFRNEYDSLNLYYQEQDYLGKLAELDKKYQSSLKDYTLTTQRKQMFYLTGIALLLLAGLVLLAFLYAFLQQQRNKLKRGYELNEQIISIISHDIKEPLLGVKLLLKKLHTDDAFVSQVSQSLEKQVMAVNNVLNNLLKAKKTMLVQYKQEEQTPDVAAVVQIVILELELNCKEKNIQVMFVDATKASPMPISPEKLQLIIYNLLNNAIKYSFTNSEINIVRLENGLRIQDFGIGMPSGFDKNLLLDVVSSQSGTFDEKGSGLGLYLIGQLIHNTTLKVVFKHPMIGTTVELVF